MIWKLRTMSIVQPGELRSTVSIKGDPRLIPGGAILRRLKIDEVPQIFNVLKGEMSLVGPRPTVEEDYLLMDSSQRRRCDVLPGLTGLAQIRGNTSLSWPERIKHDLEYISQWNMWLDVKILLQTAALALVGNLHTDPKSFDEWEEAA